MALLGEGITKRFGGVTALQDVSFRLESGEILGLIGPNGSGKTTLVNAISGFIPVDGGRIELDGTSLVGLGPAAVRRLGVTRTFQNLRLMEGLSVLENVILGMHLTYTEGHTWYWQWLPALLSTPAARRRDCEARELAYLAIQGLGLESRAHTRVGDLSYGDKKRVELARVMATGPKVLLLDEPTAGLDPDDAVRLIEAIVGVAGKAGETGTIFIEHRLDLVVGLCNRVMVLDGGCKIADDVPASVARDPEVLRVYVGSPGGT
jgi:branched-chain amino acid transport system ATP-binding protein